MGTVNRYADICTHSSKRRRVTIPICLSNKPCNDATDCIPTNRVVYPLTLFGPLSVSYIFLLLVLFCFSFLGCSAQAHVIRTHTHPLLWSVSVSRPTTDTHTFRGYAGKREICFLCGWMARRVQPGKKSSSPPNTKMWTIASRPSTVCFFQTLFHRTEQKRANKTRDQWRIKCPLSRRTSFTHTHTQTANRQIK